MRFEEIHLTSFRNYESLQITLKKGLNCVVGLNGQGKTNLLEAVGFLATAKSPITSIDGHCLKHGADGFVLFGRLHAGNSVACGYEKGKGKHIKWNGQSLNRRSELLGKIPIVFTSPDDIDLIREGSETRRKLFDQVLSQLNSEYLNMLLMYQQTLKQRNQTLKDRNPDKKLLDTYDEQLVPLSQSIAEARKELLASFRPHFENAYSDFHASESPTIRYKSDALRTDFQARFTQSRKKDLLLQYSSLGCHRDAYQFELNGEPVRNFGSQGQQKTFILSLRLAQYDLLREKLGRKPILLLDDVLDKLDDHRITNLMSQLQNGDRFEQIFISDARKERLSNIIEGYSATFVEIQNGMVL